MFGYLVPDRSNLSKELQNEYRMRYCGLCRALGAQYGSGLRTALSYEMTFLALVLDAVDPGDSPVLMRCIKHPFREKQSEIPPHYAYAADLTVLLLAAKLDDDITDDQSRTAGMLAKKLASKLEPKTTLAAQHRPTQAEQIATSLRALSEFERTNELNPDLPAGVFADLVGHLLLGGLTTKETAHANEDMEALYRFGFALGKLIYLMDATEDLRADLKHERYNPLIATAPSLRVAMLDLLSEDVLHALDALPESALTPLIRNIAQSGIWIAFRGPKSKQEEQP